MRVLFVLFLAVLVVSSCSEISSSEMTYEDLNMMALPGQFILFFVAAACTVSAIWIRKFKIEDRGCRQEARNLMIGVAFAAGFTFLAGSLSGLPGLLLSLLSFVAIFTASAAASAVVDESKGRKKFYKWSGVSLAVSVVALGGTVLQFSV